ncbi:MAG: hypothetical protein U5K37_01900 [Natrialbaceae archaeon]|nr:hypothetical protein [Natrialbaceae archaeon]
MSQIRSVLLVLMLVIGATFVGSISVAAQSAGGDAEAEFNASAEAQYLREEADRLQTEIFVAVVSEINLQAQERVGIDNVANNVSTPEEARAEASRLMNGPLYDISPDNIEEAAAGLNESAARVEDIQANLTAAADALESAEDPRAEAQRIDTEIIADINAGLEQVNEERFVLSDGVTPMEPILNESSVDVDSSTEVEADANASANTSTDGESNETSEDSMGSPLRLAHRCRCDRR